MLLNCLVLVYIYIYNITNFGRARAHRTVPKPNPRFGRCGLGGAAPPSVERPGCILSEPLSLQLIHAAPDVRINYLISMISLGAAGWKGRCLFQLHPDHSQRRKSLPDTNTNMGYFHHADCLHYLNYYIPPVLLLGYPHRPFHKLYTSV